jgi:hypothetical protein
MLAVTFRVSAVALLKAIRVSEMILSQSSAFRNIPVPDYCGEAVGNAGITTFDRRSRPNVVSGPRINALDREKFSPRMGAPAAESRTLILRFSMISSWRRLKRSDSLFGDGTTRRRGWKVVMSFTPRSHHIHPETHLYETPANNSSDRISGGRKSGWAKTRIGTVKSLLSKCVVWGDGWGRNDK